MLRRVLWIGLVVGLIGNSLFVFAENDWLASLGFTVGAPALAACYVSGLALLSLRARGARLLAPLGQVGRMALSNYVLQSVICAILFGGFGFGLYEEVGAAGLLGLTVPDLRGADPVQRLVAEPLPVWPAGMALALADLRQAPAVARVATSFAKASLAASAGAG